ncbi:MAG: HAMP domain-containing histidine kinase [Campylobacterales bacterium]|nr:HAMP domain-containing histidine kinase [Campylobacterales bacterium]
MLGLMLVASLFFSPLFAQEPQRVLILNSYPKNFQWSTEIIAGIQEVFTANPHIQADVIYMDGRQAASQDHYQKLRDAITIKRKKTTYDLIIPIDRHAYTFVLSYYDELFSHERILFSGMEHFSIEHARRAGVLEKISGVLKARPIKDNIKIIHAMIPSLKKLYILNETSIQDLQEGVSIQGIVDTLGVDFDVEYVGDMALDELEARFSVPTPDEAMLFVPFYSGNYDQFYRNYEIAYVIDSFELPVFATDSLFITKGIVGGKSALIKDIGHTTGELAVNLLSTPDAPNRIVTDIQYEYIFNYEKIKKFNLEPFLLNQSFRFVNSPVRFLDKHKKYVDALFLVLPLLILLILGLVHNIYMRIQNEKKWREAELQKNKHQQFIVQQSKLAEIGEVFSSIAHQWKNPLVEIATIAQEHVFTCKETEKEEANRYVDDIMVQVQYMTDTINDFQKFIMPSTQKSIFDVTEAIETMMNIIRHTIKYNYIDVTIDKQGVKRLMVNGYKNEFMQTLLNIVNNAKDQIGKLREQGEIKRGVITINIYSDASKIIIAISDNGGGISKEKLPHIFDPYYTTKEKGHGIGLYMTKLIIEEKMGGKIWASNTPAGACFTIILGSAT